MDAGSAPAVAVLLTGEGMPLAQIVDYAVSLENAGFAGVWHEEILRELFVPQAPIAARTKRIRLGTAVSRWSRTPVTSALTAANLGQGSGARYVHGVGTGPPARNEHYHGIAYEHPVARMRVFIEAIRTVWRAHSVQITGYDGRWYRLTGYSRRLRQERDQIPLGLQRCSATCLGLAGSHADALIFNVLATKEYYCQYALPHLAAGAKPAGRGPTGDRAAGSVLLSTKASRMPGAGHATRSRSSA